MSKLLLTSAAEQDFTEALCWYAERSPQAVEGFDAEFARGLESIQADPRRFPLCDQRHRYYAFCLLHSSFPSVPIISRFVGAST